MRLSHNLASLNIFNEQTKNIKAQNKALTNISSGIKINSAADDPNAIAKSEKMRMQIRGLQMAQRNVQNGVSMLQTAEGGLDSITEMIQRVRELTVQAGGVTDINDKNTIQNEINQTLQGIDNTATNTEFNGNKLLSCDSVTDNNLPKSIYMSSGANVDEKIEIPMYNVKSNVLGDSANAKYLNNIDVTKAGGVDEALGIIDTSLQQITSIRSEYGAIENRFEKTYDITSDIGDVIQGAESNVRDADISEEMMNFSKFGVLIEAGNAMMVQTNRFPQDILKVLQNVK